MIEFLNLLGVLILAAAGMGLRRWRPLYGLFLNQWLPVGLLGLWLVEAISGIFFGPEAPHRVLGHAFVIAAWLAAPLGVGVFLFGAILEGTPRSWLGAGLAAFSVVAALLTAVTGYTGPTRAATGAEHVLRFEIFHLFAAPALTAAVLVGWAILARTDLKENG
ncbi:MAG: hypothetical protein L0Z52_05865 [Acidobacteria bacterium]|nr:hypothetical protein [Acidobacteriota bacterium]